MPVVASDFTAWSDIVRSSNCGVLVDPLDARAIARAIGYVLRHPREAEGMGRRGREAVMARYGWEGEGAKLVALYADLCA